MWYIGNTKLAYMTDGTCKYQQPNDPYLIHLIIISNNSFIKLSRINVFIYKKISMKISAQDIGQDDS